MNYIKEVAKFYRVYDKEFLARFSDPKSIRILHGAMGITGEAGEIMEMLKKHLNYNRELDLLDLKEELGDICWYMAIILDELDSSFEEIMYINIKKLSKRYSKGFSESAANNRDKEAERAVIKKAAEEVMNENDKLLKKLAD